MVDTVTPAQACRIAGCTLPDIRRWARAGVVRTPGVTTRYSFRDLVVLRLAAGLAAAGLRPAAVARALDAIANEVGDALTGVRVVVAGNSVLVCADDGALVDALRGGQLAFVLPAGALADEVEASVRAFSDDRTAFLAQLEPGEPGRSAGTRGSG